MYNLKLGGVLEKLSGLIIGQFTEYEEDRSLGKELYAALADLVKEYDYPVCFDFPAWLYDEMEYGLDERFPRLHAV